MVGRTNVFAQSFLFTCFLRIPVRAAVSVYNITANGKENIRYKKVRPFYLILTFLPQILGLLATGLDIMAIIMLQGVILIL